uniref:Uncharacterized protein n=1 Tax=Anopheles arabiensis TaxID=7173 RepID=A0A182IGZ9_ANOAR
YPLSHIYRVSEVRTVEVVTAHERKSRENLHTKKGETADCESQHANGQSRSENVYRRNNQ